MGRRSSHSTHPCPPPHPGKYGDGRDDRPGDNSTSSATSSGKAVCSHNAITHGIFAAKPISSLSKQSAAASASYFRNLGETYQERLDVIGNPGFVRFVERLEREEDLEFEKFNIGGDKVKIVTIKPEPGKVDKDIGVPQLSPNLARKRTLAEEIAAIDVSAFKAQVLPKKRNDKAAKEFRCEGYDIITLEKIVEREYTIPEAQTPEEVISYYAKRIAQDVKLPS